MSRNREGGMTRPRQRPTSTRSSATFSTGRRTSATQATTAAIDEAFNSFVLPTRFTRATRDEANPEEAAGAADTEVRRILARWKVISAFPA